MGGGAARHTGTDLIAETQRYSARLALASGMAPGVPRPNTAPPPASLSKALGSLHAGGSCGSNSLATFRACQQQQQQQEDTEQGQGIWVTINDGEGGDAGWDAGCSLPGPRAGGDVSRLLASLPIGGDAAEASEPTESPPLGDLQSASCTAKEYFVVDLQRESTRDCLGIMVVNTNGGDIVLTRIRGGAMQRWNEACPDQAVKTGDLIMEVNGVRGTIDERTVVMQRSLNLSILIARPQPARAGDGEAVRFRIQITRDSQLGLDVDVVTNRRLTILTIKEGPVEAWNATADPSEIVLPGDVIEEVNGVRSDCQVLLGLIRSNNDLVIGILRHEQH